MGKNIGHNIGHSCRNIGHYSEGVPKVTKKKRSENERKRNENENEMRMKLFNAILI